MKKIVIIDNYDSFTFNLAHYFEALNCEVSVFRNDEFDLDELRFFDKIVLSPGPGLPSEAGLLKKVIETYATTKSILGICLGQQAIAEVFGGKLKQLKEVKHGVHTFIKTTVSDEVLFQNLPEILQVGRYHSWVVNVNLPSVLEATSEDDEGEIMSLRHRTLDVKGVQFHPESILTLNGKTMLNNWIDN
ncbi:anthranilate synthase component II [Flavobacterium sp. SM2513]|uniref:anthranilate synthase component II n=1 Tax=Flavobacterium sp. SM2513 TaxID=3424766 RepID=UPI003D7F504A